MAGTPQYVGLANLTLGASASTVTFSSIAGTYRDLYLVIAGNVTTSAAGVNLRLNGDTTTTNYSTVTAQGDGSTATTSSSNTFGLGSLSTTQGAITATFFDYAQTNKHKGYLVQVDRFDSAAQTRAGSWANTAAVTSLAVVAAANAFAADTTFTLYGVN